ncbi:MAG: ABC transporter ATP-binding protein [Candidatus Dormibacteria bacterium]
MHRWGPMGMGGAVELTRARSRDTVPRIVQSFRPYRLRVVAVAALILLTSILGIVNPLLIKPVFDAFNRHDFQGLLPYAALMAVMPVVLGVLGSYQTYLNAALGQRVMRDLRNRLYAHLQRLSLRFFTDTRTGEIQSRLANDVGGVENVLTNTASSVLSNITIVASTVVAMAILDWRLTAITLAVIPLFVVVTYRVGAIRREVSRQTQKTLADMSALTQETLSVSGVLLTKTFGRETEELARFQGENQRLSDLLLRGQMVGRWFFAFIQVFFSVMPAVIYVAAGWLAIVHGQDIQVGTLVAFTTLQSRLFFPVGQLLNIQTEVQGALALFDRIFEYLDIEPDITDRPGAEELLPGQVRGEVAFEGVGFRYLAESAEPTLDDISFEARPGQLVALVGPSGAGKTTMLSLVPRLYDVTRGRVLIDGRDVRNLQMRSLGQLVGVVTQETYLFNATVRRNLEYGRPGATQAELEAACRAAAIHDRIAALPEGYDTLVGERGYKLSGGEKQRLALARVILKDPRILLLDEATSSLDTASERLIQGALARLMAGRTTIAIAHRLSTILAAEQILVVDRGRIVERGHHESLLRQGGLYARLYREQFASEAMWAPMRDEAATAEG